MSRKGVYVKPLPIGSGTQTIDDVGNAGNDLLTLYMHGYVKVGVDVISDDLGMQGMDGISPEPPNPLINFKENPLDSRVIYQGPVHCYISENGIFKFSKENEWPLEYKDNAPIGRHEPEDLGVNSFSWSWNLDRWGKNFDAVIAESEIKSPAGGVVYSVTTGDKRFSGIYSRPAPLVAGTVYCESIFIHADTLSDVLLIGNAGLGGQSRTVDFKNKTSNIPAPFEYGFDQFEGGWVRYWFSGPATVTGSQATVIYTGAAQTYTVWGVQHEEAARPSSPILTDGAAVTRETATVRIQRQEGASGIRFYYTDGTIEVMEFTSDSIEIPLTTRTWSERYIVSAQFIEAKPLDLTQPIVDSRITYSGPSHYYITSNNTLKLSDVNEWPLEYKNGKAIGRHIPEPETKNLLTLLSGDSLTVTAENGFKSYRETTSGTFHRLRLYQNYNDLVTLTLIIRPVNRQYFALRIATETTGVFQQVGISLSEPVINYKSDKVQSASVEKLTNELYMIRCTTASKGGFMGLLTAESAVTDDTVPQLQGNTSAGFDVFAQQSEAGLIATSPTEINSTRAISSVTIQRPDKEVNRAVVTYSDGYKDNLLFNDTEAVLVPLHDTSWRQRFLVTVEFFKD